MNEHPRNMVAEAPVISDATVEASYDVMALITACEHGLRYLDDVGEKYAPNVCGSLARSLKIACEIAEKVHHDVERVLMAQQRDKGAEG